jgi:uncharacterized protein (DUF433 family)
VAETTILAPHIAQTPGVRGGRPYIEAKGVAVAFVAQAYETWCWSADRIADEFNLTLAEVHAAMAYYWDHRPEIEARAAADNKFVEEMRKVNPSSLRMQNGD